MSARIRPSTTPADLHHFTLRAGLVLRVAAAALASSFAIACGDVSGLGTEEGVREDEQSLYGTGTLWPTSSDGITTIDVCWSFDAGGDEDEKQWVQSAVEGQWAAVSSVRFTGWDRCTTAQESSFNGIRINDGDGWSSQVGYVSGGTNMYVDFNYSWDQGTHDDCSGKHRYCDGLIGVHEFGHALGFDHEQVRPENANEEYCDDWGEGEGTVSGGDEYTEDFDTDSIMSYCAEWQRSTPHISKGDREGVYNAYGSKPNYVTDQVLLYEDEFFDARGIALRPGTYNLSSTNLGNDVLSSLRIPSGWSVRLYEHANQGGSYVDLTSDVTELEYHSFNDKASSITVTGTMSSSAVTIYSNTSYGGVSQKLYPGLYNTSALTIGNDTLSGVVVPSGWTVTLYENSNFSGSTYALTATDTNLIAEGWNDRASSIRVEGPASRTPVMIFKDASYKGAAQELWPGRYRDSGDLLIGNNDLSSVIVPSGWTVWLMEETDCHGDFRQYTSSQSTLGSFNDETTCVVVQGPTS